MTRAIGSRTRRTISAEPSATRTTPTAISRRSRIPSATYQLAYAVDGSGNVTQTDVTDPRGTIKRLTFNGSHYITSDVEAYGTSLARTTTTTRQTGSNLVTALVDGLSRRTEYTYDTAGHVL